MVLKYRSILPTVYMSHLYRYRWPEMDQHMEELHLLPLKSITFPSIPILTGDDGLHEPNLGLWGMISTTLIVFV